MEKKRRKYACQLILHRANKLVNIYPCVKKLICKREQQKREGIAIHLSRRKQKIGNKNDYWYVIFSVIWKRGPCVPRDLRSITRTCMSEVTSQHHPADWGQPRCTWPANTVRRSPSLFTLFHVRTLLIRSHTACFIYLMYQIRTCIWIFHPCYKGKLYEIRSGSNLKVALSKKYRKATYLTGWEHRLWS